MGLLDAALHIGRETTYGTPAALTRSIEAMGDGHKRNPQFLQSKGRRAGMQALGSDRSRIVNMGAEGAIEVDMLTKGMGMLLRAAFGLSTNVQEGAGPAWLQTHSTTADGPKGESLTVQLIRPPVTSASVPFTYHGGKVKSWAIEQEDDLLKFKVDLDYEDEDTSTAAGVATYVAGGTPFAWEDCVVTVAGTPVDLKKLSIKGDNALDTDRRYLRGSALKKEPLRKGIPSYEGELTADFEDLTAYNRFVAGTVVPIVATWTGSLIDAGFPFMFRTTLAAVQFTGGTPEVGNDGPAQPMPFTVLHNRVDPAVKAEYRTSDTSY